jgi:hypothetical protein
MHFEALHVGVVPASLGGVVHAPAALHAPPMLVQSTHSSPPTPQVVTDWPPTQTPFMQHPLHDDPGPHAGGPSNSTSGVLIASEDGAASAGLSPSASSVVSGASPESG